MYEAIFKYCDIGGIFQDLGQMVFDFSKNFMAGLYEILKIFFAFLFLYTILCNFIFILEEKFRIFVDCDFESLIALFVYLYIFSPICWGLAQYFLITAPIICIWTIWLHKTHKMNNNK